MQRFRQIHIPHQLRNAIKNDGLRYIFHGFDYVMINPIPDG
jgi:hypothetical protein